MPNKRSMYTDAQWKWLHDRFLEGYSLYKLTEFAITHRNNITHHWARLGLSTNRSYLKPLSREEFDALGD